MRDGFEEGTGKDEAKAGDTHNSVSGGSFLDKVFLGRDIIVNLAPYKLILLTVTLACVAGAAVAVAVGDLADGYGRPTLPGGTSEPPAAENGHLYAISHENASVWSWDADTGWAKIGPTPAGQIAAGPAGLFATNPEDERIFRYDGAGDSASDWEFIGSGQTGQRLAVGDRLWVRDAKAVRQWDPSTRAWTTLRDGPVAEIHGGPSGLFATEPDGDHALTRWVPETGQWLPTGRGALGFAVGSALYGLSRTDSRVYRWSGHGGENDWVQLGTDVFDSVHAGPAGLFAARDGELFAYDETAGRWRSTGGGGGTYAVAADHVYRRDAGGVWQWTGTGGRDGKWVRIGTPAAALAASG